MPDTPDKEEMLATLVEEYLEARRTGESTSLEAFAAAHPEYAAELTDLLKGMEEMENLSVSTHAAAAAPTHYPTELGGFQLLERIGAGGMGTVFRALQKSLNREVAVKILSPAWNADERHREAFENESRLIAALHHTNIVEVFGAGQEGEYRYYVMSLVEGQGITPACIRAAYPGMPFEKAVANVALQAAQALAYAHSCGVLHRDVKPGNLLLDKDGVLRVGDFGLATVLNDGEAAPLVTQSHDGTLRYMAPERLMKGINTYAGDQYSLGVTLYELISNRPAFRESAPGKLIHRICNEPLSALRGEGELGAIVNKSISFDPEDRYASMQEMADDLRRCLNGEPVKARPVSWMRRYAMWIRRRPAVAAWSHAAALLVFLLFVSIVWGYVAESTQRRKAERNAAIADSALQQIFASMADRDSGDNTLWQPTQADARLLMQLMPYYEEIAELADNGDAKMAPACQTLAIIALQTGDYATARKYFERALNHLEPASYAYVKAVNGLCAANYASGQREQADAALRELLENAQEVTAADARLELVRSIQMFCSGPQFRRRWQRAERRSGQEAPKPRMKYMQLAVSIVQELLAEQPESEKTQERRLELLLQPMPRRVLRPLLPEGKSLESLFDDMLRQYPDNQLMQKMYVQWGVRSRGRRSLPELERSSVYARSLLASNPGSSEMLMLYIAARDMFTAALEKNGMPERAARENEKTLGVISLITTRADYTPEMRERLAVLVSMHPRADEARSQQQAEISLLLDNHDEKQLEKVRERIRKLRQRRQPSHHPRPFPRRPR